MKRVETAVYIISRGNAGPCKIGISRDPAQRLKALQISSPEKLTLEAAFWFGAEAAAARIEAALHDTFGNERLASEWFARTPYELLGQMPSYLDFWGHDMRASA